MAQLLEGARKKITRANYHITNLVAELEKFKKQKPFKTFIEFGPVFQEYSHKIKMTEPLPENIADTAWDAVNNLRAALDHAGYATAVASGRSDPRYTSFPFANTRPQLKDAVKSRCNEIPCEIRDTMISFKPYKEDGNRLLWAINEACNMNKHRIIVPIIIANNGICVNNLHVIKPSVSIPSPKWDKIKNELVYLKTSPNADCTYDISVNLDIVFGELDVIHGQSVLPILNKMKEIVAQIINAVERTAIKSGLCT